MAPGSGRPAFGAENRSFLIQSYFGEHGDPSAGSAWKDVYRLLLWIDRTTGLAHCYESDKSQPGRHWYERSLRFHAWLSRKMAIPPGSLEDHLDWMFRRVVEAIADEVAQTVARRDKLAIAQRAPYAGQGFPEPGADPDLERLIVESLRRHLQSEPSREELRTLTRSVRAHMGQENKRKNLLGEGFEDVLAAIIKRTAHSDLRVLSRPVLHDIGGFYEPRGAEKAKVVDLAVVTPDRERMLLTAKWSVRADREEQFLTDFEAYSRLESEGRPFKYYWFTNEFDPARLAAACDKMVGNSPLFDAVVHIAPEGVLAAYGDDLGHSRARIPNLVQTGRIVSLGAWLESLRSP